MMKSWTVTLGLLVGCLLVSPVAAEHPLDPIIAQAKERLGFIQNNVKDYSAIVVKRERAPDNRLPEHDFMFVKVRNRKEKEGTPFSVYMKFLKPRAKQGREVIFVEGKNNGQIIAHESGFLNLVRLNLDPKSKMAMSGNRYPITELGIENMCAKLATRAEASKKFPEPKVEIIKDAKVGERLCTLYKITHLKPVEGLNHHISQVFVDQEHQVPIRYASFKFPNEGEEPPVDEEYTYTDLKLNIGLTERDFDPNNRDYRFP